MKINIDIRETVASIVLAGRFDFSTHGQFSDCYVAAIADGGVKQIEVEMGNVEYVDSSALGMLLLLGERAKLANKSIVLARPNEMVTQVLDRVGFNKIFVIRK